MDFLTRPRHSVPFWPPFLPEASSHLPDWQPSALTVVPAASDTDAHAGYHAVAPYLPGYFPSSLANDDDYSLVPQTSSSHLVQLRLTRDCTGCNFSIRRELNCSPWP